MSVNHKVLIIDDNRTNLSLLRTHLEQMGLTAILAENSQVGLEQAQSQCPALILTDIMMPDMDGLELCRKLKKDPRTMGIPIIFISARDQVEDKITGLQVGAIDYITKPYNPAELKARVNIVLQMLDLQEQLIIQANTDELTGLANRRRLVELLEYEVARVKSNDLDLSLMLLDLDHFKSINDTFGHLGGDAVLAQLAGILRDHVQSMDVPGRYGEEFVILMPNTSSSKALASAERLRQTIASTHWQISLEHVPITASIGVASLQAYSSIDPYDLIKRADNAMYLAKRRGRNCVVFSQELDLETSIVLPENEDVRVLQMKITQMASRLRMQMLGSVSALAKAMEAKDPYTIHHSEHVQIYSRAIAQEMGLSSEFIDKLTVAAQLHDIGKLSIPNEIIMKTGELTQEERQLIMTHPMVSVHILEPLGIMQEELRIIKHHHERYDGSGYPDGLADKRIPIGSRIMAVADVYDAITANAVYRPTLSGDEALELIAKGRGREFDPEVVDSFLAIARQNYDIWPLKSAKELLACR